MTLDLGVRRKRRLTLAQRVVLAIAALVTVALPAWMFGGSFLKRRDAALNLQREWAIEGPPCKSLTKAEFEARGLTVRKGTVYEAATFYRQFGHMQCTGLRYAGGWSQNLYPVCQFTTPKALKVSTDKGDWYFDIGPGQPATIAIPRGEVRCVLAANFTMASLLAD